MNKHLANARKFVDLFENKFEVLGYKFGIDPLVGLIPGLGDTLTSLFSFYLFWVAYKLGAPIKIYLLMFVNIIIDYIIGILPVIGDVSDFVYKSNVVNLKLLEVHAKK